MGKLIPMDARAPVPDLSIIELGIAIVCSRRRDATAKFIADEIARWFGKDIGPAQIELPLKRLIARGDVIETRKCFATCEEGRVRAETAARGLVHLIFRDRYFFDVGKLLDVTLVKEDGKDA